MGHATPTTQWSQWIAFCDFLHEIMAIILEK